MSSNIKVTRICQYCSKEFTARTTVTKYCSVKCNKAGYRARKRAEKVNLSNAETTRMKQQPIKILKAKEYLSINEVCQLLGISRRTVYRMIEQGDLNKIKIGSRTLIKREILNRLLSNKETAIAETTKHQIKDLNVGKQKGAFEIEDCYTLTEVQCKYGVSESTVQHLIKRNCIPKIKMGRFAYVPKKIIDGLLT